MRLPKVELAEVPQRKITEYLLSLSHPDGRSKAVFFRRFGFAPERWAELADALQTHATLHEVSSTEETDFGVKYMIDGELPCPDGRSPNVRSVWFVELEASRPTLVTAYPLSSHPGSGA